MTDDDLQIRAEIEALCVEFWYRVDHQNGEGVADLFSEDGVYSVADGPQRGTCRDRRVVRAARRPRAPALTARAQQPAPDDRVAEPGPRRVDADALGP